MEKLDMERGIIIFGAGKSGEDFYRYCRLFFDKYKKKPVKFLCFVDNCVSEDKAFLEDMEIKSPAALNEIRCFNEYIVIATDKYYQEISMQLIQLGFIENKDFFSIASYAENIFSEKELAISLLEEMKDKPLHIKNYKNYFLRLLMMSERGRELREEFPQYRITCSMFPRQPVIFSDGLVVSCCMDAYGKQSLGDLDENTLDDILKADSIDIFKKDMWNHELCRNCIGRSPAARMAGTKQKQENWLKEKVGGLQIEIMAACNYSCLYCPSQDVHKYRKYTKMNLPKVFEKGIVK